MQLSPHEPEVILEDGMWEIVRHKYIEVYRMQIL